MKKKLEIIIFWAILIDSCNDSNISSSYFVWFSHVEDVLVRMMDDKTGETMKTLHGHSGPVYSASFSPDRSLLLSSSEDASSNYSY